MIIIREEEFMAPEGEVDQQYKEELAEQLRHDRPQATQGATDQELWDTAREAVENARELEIFEGRDIYRFILLSFAPKELRESPFLQSVLIRVLNNLDMSGENRMDFIEKQIIPRIGRAPSVRIDP
ncbi:hypothetical protein [Candidatus Thiosymbion oneisti]|uniref:hypothetical protein n=1 Tax=Candidatus Thiosymbion oneisti TaxID=589554 RepID=UPI000B7EE4F2|nr:hypothetical protein [Candidatus Thiosymbion oneisti]